MSTDLHWEAWGLKEPYYGVLTDERYRASAMDDEAREAFFESGRVHVASLLETCRDRLLPGFAPRRALDFGCGVGRVAIPLATQVDEVVGLDVSPSMLAEARRNCERYGTGNLRLHRSDDALSAIDGRFDLVHSTMVLQHIEVARGRLLFERLIDAIAPGGIGAIQVTYAWDQYPEQYGQPPPDLPTAPADGAARGTLRRFHGRLFGRRASPLDAPGRASADPEMTMYYYNLSELMFVLLSFGVNRVHTELTNHGGALGAFLFFATPEG
jgi:SAM-dependent methyltransferase